MNTNLKEIFLKALEIRFKENKHRHRHLDWQTVLKKLADHPDKIQILFRMEETGGEPDVVDFEDSEICFVDCSKESPKGRRSFCYDDEALQKRKENKPANSAINFCKELGIELLTEQQYHFLQSLEAFDLKTSSWIKTPKKIRNLGGALFCDRRYETIFTYHNSAESYYSTRGFRGLLMI